MNLLPDDLLQDIFSRLPVRSTMKCRCVCRLWRDLTRDSFFIRKQMAQSIQAKPGFMLHTTVCYAATCFSSELFFMDQRYSPKPTLFPMNFSILNFREFYVKGSCNGLLFLVSRANKFIKFVCNPFLRQVIKLPDNNAYPSGRAQVYSLISEFGFCPKTQSYKVVEFSRWVVVVGNNQLQNRSEIHVYRLGEYHWKRIGFKVNQWPPPMVANKPLSVTTLNGAFHWVRRTSANFVFVFSLESEVFAKMPGPKTAGTGMFTSGVLDNCLSITHSHLDADVWIMKKYGVKDSWEKRFVIRIHEPNWSMELVQVLDYHVEDGQLLLFYNNQVLGTYDLEKRIFQRIEFGGRNVWYDVLHHLDTLVSPFQMTNKIQMNNMITK